MDAALLLRISLIPLQSELVGSVLDISGLWFNLEHVQHWTNPLV